MSTPEVIDYTEILKGLEGKWVIVSEDKKRVIKSANSLSDLADRIRDGLILKVPDPAVSYSPSILI